MTWLLLILVIAAAAAAWWRWLRAAPVVSEEAMRPMRPIGYSCASRGPATDECCAALVAQGDDLVDRDCEEYCERTGLCGAA